MIAELAFFILCIVLFALAWAWIMQPVKLGDLVTCRCGQKKAYNYICFDDGAGQRMAARLTDLCETCQSQEAAPC